ncbi:MAG: DUF3552 domain-containing protein, partial [Kiritimatiellae bacterium]|nr:DUF3552 domain-containing protein [Kiritimatiellia bacterium]
MYIPWWLPTVIGLVALALGFYAHAIFSRLRVTEAEKSARTIVRDAELRADVILKEAKLHAQDEAIRVRKEFEEETKSRREELRAVEERVTRRETNLDRKVALLDSKEAKLEQQLAELGEQRAALQRRDEELQQLTAKEQETLQRIAALSTEQARETIMKQMEEEMRSEAGALLRRIQEETRAAAERDAREIITTAIERYAADQAGEITTCTVNLPNDEMKGRIIGREGRNIRALEA